MSTVPGLEEVDDFYQRVFGFVPNGVRIMAHRPDIVHGFIQLRRAVFDPATSQVPVELKNLIGHIASKAGGCRYCQAHAVFGAERAGTDAPRLEALWDYPTSDLFSDAERAALDLAAAAGTVPNLVDGELFARVREHWDDGQIVEIVAVIAMYGFLNRWNDTMASDLEDISREAAESALGAVGWQPPNHQ